MSSYVFIDGRVQDYEALLSALAPNVAVILLDPTRDGVTQIAAALEGIGNLDAIYIISHGSEGTLYLGDVVLTNDVLSQYTAELEKIGGALTEAGDLLLYGCNVAQGEAGEAFIRALAKATGADVAASTDFTGSSALRGDWELEALTGPIEAPVDIFSSSGFEGLLANTAPVLNAVAPTLTTITEDETANAGQTVASVLGSSLTDQDAGAVQGIALYGVTGSYGKWQYSTNGGTNWTDVGTVFSGAALLLRPADLIRWLPDGTNGTTASISYYGWDQTFGVAGNKVNLTTRGGTTAFSTDSDTASLTVTSVPDAPTISSGAVESFAENATGTVYTATATDPDAGTTFTYTLGGTDAGLFNINSSTGVVTFKAALNYEAPADAGANNVYDLTVTASDGALTGSKNVAITVTNVNEAPAVSSGAAVSFAENATGTVYTATATDPDANTTLTYSLGGVDAGLFNINSSTGVVTFKAAPNYEAPVDTGANNVYDLTVTASDGALTGSKNVSITVTNVNEAPTFLGGDGKVTTAIGTSTDVGYSVALQPDGKILVAGYSDNGSSREFALVRYNADGSLDTTFSGDGKLTTAIGPGFYEEGHSVVLQPDGKILVAGHSSSGYPNIDFALVRYNADGSLDTTFSEDGKLTTAISPMEDRGNSVALQSDGKILVAGYGYSGSSHDFALVRYNADGSLDTTFSGDGKLTTDLGASDFGRGVALQSDGSIVVVGSSNSYFALVRYNADGSLDLTFSGDGKLTTSIGTTEDFGDSVALQPDGKILVAGYSYDVGTYDFTLVRYIVDGSLDRTFSGDGKLTTAIGTSSDFGYSVALQPDGKIVVAGSSNNGSNEDFALVRYNANGSLDTTFSGDGKLTTAIGTGTDVGYSVALQPDGKIVVAGYSINGSNNDFALVRYNADGSLDTTFDSVNTLGGSVSYTENASAVRLDTDVQVWDVELIAAGNYAGSSLTLSRHGGASSEDLFSSGTAALGALTEGSNLTVSGTTIGTVTQNSAGTLVLTLNANATQSLLNTAMQGIAYASSSEAPPASVQIDWVFSDGNTGAQGSGGALTATGSTTVSITAINDAPVVQAAGPTLMTITEDETANAGQTVASVLGSSVTDQDAGAVQGIALYGVTGSYGKWQYSTNGGTNWTDVGAVSSGAALLLRPADLIRWLPDGTNGTTASISYYGWDQTSGSAGGKVSVATRGGTTTFSTDSDTASLTVTSVADAPRLITLIPDQSANEDAVLGYTIPAGAFSEVDAGDSAGYFASLANDDPLPGWLVFNGATRTFSGTPDYSEVGIYDIKVTAYDTTFLTVSDTFRLTVNNVNDAPVVQAAGPTLMTITEDETANAGQTVASVLGSSVTDQDAGAVQGIALYGVTGSYGKWQYSTNGGTNWTDVGAVSSGAALLLRPADLIRWLPDGTNGTTASISYYGWDQTSGSAGGKVSVATRGGTTTFSTDSDTASVTVTSVPDAPTVSSGATASFAENATGTVYTATATDPDAGTTFTYTLGGTDAGLFNINSSTGVVTFKAAPNYEAPADAGANNVYDLTVTASDGALTGSKNVAITVTNVNEAPSVTSGASASFAENATGTVYTATATDPDAGTTFTYSLGGTDAGLFNINAISGAITFKAAPNYEAPADTGANNVYDLTVTASDGALTGSENVSITVTNVNEAPTFLGGDGKVTTAIGTSTDVGYSVALQPDGKILVAGYSYNGSNSDFALVRYNADGSLDTTFSGDGKLTTAIGTGNDYGRGVALQPDGKILVTGYGHNGSNDDFALVRYNADGSLDTTFSGDGKLTTAIGTSLDEGFRVALQPDGKIVVAGISVVASYNDIAVARYNADGSLDTTFSGDGMVTTAIGSFWDEGWGLALQSDGKILVAGLSSSGYPNTDFALVRYNANGSLDTTFSGDGKLTTAIGAGVDEGFGVVLQPDGKILVAGYSYNASSDDFALVRYNMDGSLDTTFSGDGMVTTTIRSISDYDNGGPPGSRRHSGDVALQSDGKILVAGYGYNGSSYDFALVRYNANGSLDTTFSGDGKLTTAIGAGVDVGWGVVLQPDGKIVVAGYSNNGSNDDFALVRYNADGSLDAAFGSVNTLDSVNTLGGSVSYTENASAVRLDTDVQVWDVELSAAGNYAGSSLTLSRHGGASSEDLFSSGTAALGALTEGSNLTVSGTTIGTVTQNSAGTLVLTLNANATQSLLNTAMQGIAYASSSEAPPASVQIDWVFSDGNTGAQGSGGALTATGSTTVSITAINDAPVVQAAGPTLMTITEDETANAGQTVASVLGSSVTDQDAGAVQGIALYGVTGSYGKWQYSTNGGTNWTDVGAVSSGAALLLRPADLIRWLPDGTNGTTASISYYGWDQTSGSAGGKVSVATRGGTTTFSTDSDTASVTVTSVPDAPTVSSGATASFAENATGTVYTATATDPDAGTTFTYTLGGTDAGLFNINSSTGVVTFKAAPNYEAPADAGANNVYDLTVTASDGALTGSKNVAITVTNVNEAPSVTSGASASFAENATGTVYTATATDPDAGTTFTYSLGGTDAGLFNINAISGAITFKAAPNYEAPADTGANNVYDLTVTASDGALTGSENVSITVTNVNEVPTISSGATASFAENATGTVYTATATDPDAGTTFTYSLEGTDADLFNINASSGAITFKAAPNYEAPAVTSGAKNVYDLTVTASDGALTGSKNVAITVTNVNEAPSVTSGASASFAENATGTVYTATATDPDAGTTFTYSLGGTDAGLFNINSSTGAITFKAAPNYEAPADAGTNNVYDLAVTASDGALTDTKSVSITVTDVNEVPTISSGATASFAENATGTVYTATATDPDAGTTFTYTLGGTDAGLFNINSSTGVVTFKAAPNYEAPADAGANNVYDLTVTASDGALTGSKNVAITVTNVNEAPSVTSGASASFAENATGTVYTATATDPDAGTTFTYSLGGTDAGLFNINSSTGAITFKAAPNYEAPADAGTNNVYDLAVTASDGALTDTKSVSITVTDVNEVPTISSGAVESFAENATGTVYTATATDPDAGTTFTYTLGGTDAGLFNINSSTGAITFKAEPNYEAPADSGANNVYDLTVTASDGALTGSENVAITVTNVNEVPTISSGATASFAENATGTVYTAMATDPDAGTTFTYSLGGTDADLFNINASSGAITFKAAPNYEAPAVTSGAKNVYDFTVTASDGALTGSKNVSITVTDVNEAPIFFHGDGKVTTAIGTRDDVGYSVVLQPYGKILVVGYSDTGNGYDFALVRYNADGSLDTTFSEDGKLTMKVGGVYDEGHSVVLQPDGKIMVAGSSYNGSSNFDFALVRFNANGSLDTTFSGDGKLTTAIGTGVDKGFGVVLQPDGKIVVAGISDVAGYNDIAVARYNADGSLDTTFSGDGMVTTAFGSLWNDGLGLALQSDGKILVAGYSYSGYPNSADFALVRYNADGSLDTTFSGDGKLTTAIGTGTDLGYSVAQQPDGKILVAGFSNNGNENDFALVRYNADGSLDTTFSGDGMVTTAIGTGNDRGNDWGRSIVLQPDGKILVAGYSNNFSNVIGDKAYFGYDFALVRYNADGSLDTTFSGDGKLTTTIGAGNDFGYSVVLQPDGKILVTGSSFNGSNLDFALVRYNADGSLDTTFGSMTEAKASFAENATGTVYTATATDPDAVSTLTYSLGGTDAGLFNINSSTGAITFKAAPNYEAPADAGANNVYDLTVTASDGALTGSENVSITVTNVNEVPTISSGATASFAENATGTVYTATATDPDAGTTFTYSLGGTDADLFNINSSTGVVTFKAAPNYEAPAVTSGAKNVYDFTVTASDGALTGSKNVSITVTDVNEAPIFFHGDGKVTTAIGTRDDVGYSVVLQPYGKILVVGYSDTGNGYDFALVRYNADGSLDTTFSEDGKLTLKVGRYNDEGHSVVLQPDGKILVAGVANSGYLNSDFALVRFNANGSLDTTFSGDGKLTTAIVGTDDVSYSVALQPDGKILVAGYSDNGSSREFALFRYTADGSLDTTFSGDGKLTTAIGTEIDEGYSVALQPDGKILVAGFSTSGYPYTDFALVRYTADGSLDTTFSGDGKVTTAIGTSSESGYSVALQPDGKILVGGFSYGRGREFALVRYNADGSLDTTFSGDGMVTTAIGEWDWGRSIVLQPDGKILVAGFGYIGSSYDFALLRYNADGSLDTTFSGDGKLTTTIGAGNDFGYSVVLQPDGKILVTGSSFNGSNLDFALVRYNADGSLDTTFGSMTEATASFAENATGTVYTATATDPDAGSTLTYSLGGTDAGLFSINSSTGVVTFKAAPNYEALADAGANNVYDLTVTASDGALTGSENVSITVTNVNEAPTISSGATANFAENATGTVYSATATDPDAGSTLTYSLGGTDAGLFNINSSTGVVTFKSAPNYEAPADAGANNVYDFTVTASDGALTDTKSVSITVTDVNEALADFAGDGKSDLLWRNDNGMVAIWEMNGLTQKASAVVATIPNEWKIVDGAGDYDGDGKSDLLWRNDNGMVAIWEMDGLTQKAAAVVATIPNEWKIVDGAGDYDGDGKSDLLWRNDNGMVAIWEMNGLTQKASAVVATIPNEWKIVDGAGDYDGDGKSDLLWRNDNGMVAIWEMDGLTQKASAVVATIPNEWKIVDGAGDYDGDGKSDLLWRNDNGMVAIWEMNGLTQKASAVVATIPNEWKIVDGEGDYDGDGKSDLLWRNDNGMVAIWEMNGLTQKASAVVATIPNEWKIQGGVIQSTNTRRDYDGDGKSDLLWRNDSGMVAIWEMNGLTQKASAVVATIPNEWKIVDGAGDYDGDGKSDLLWRNDNGMVAIWEMNGLTQKASAVVATIPNEWKIVDGAGDYDGDGKSDLLWRNDNGMVAIWEMNGLTQKASAVVATIPTEWKIVDGAGDYDGDGKSDLLWRNDNGMVAIWEMDGLTQKAAAVVATIPNEWKIVDGAGDYDGDGKSDLLWRNDNGMVAIWEMNGLTQKASAVVATIPNEWKIVDGAGDYDGDGKSDLLWRNDNGMMAIWEMDGLTQKASAVVATIPNEWFLIP